MGGWISRPFSYLLLRLLTSTVRFTGVDKCCLEIGYLAWVCHKHTEGGGNLAVPGWITNHLVRQAANNFVAGPILGCVLRIFAELALIAIGSSADRALEWVEGF